MSKSLRITPRYTKLKVWKNSKRVNFNDAIPVSVYKKKNPYLSSGYYNFFHILCSALKNKKA